MQKQRSKLLLPQSGAISNVKLVRSRTALRERLQPWRKAAMEVLPIFAATRFIFLVLTYLGVVLFSVSDYSSATIPLHDLLTSWNHFDAVRFAIVATRGYTSLEYAAFFPFYPSLEHLLMPFTLQNVYLAGMLISNLASFGMFLVLYRLVETEFDSETARRTIFYLAIFPTAFFLFAAYNESLFLLFALSALYAMRRGAWWLAGFCAELATLTRSAGLILLFIFIYEYIRQVLPRVRFLLLCKRYRELLSPFANLFAVLLIPLALATYSWYLYIRFTDPLAFSHAQALWRMALNPPWYGPFLTMKTIIAFAPTTFFTVHNLIDLAALLFFTALLLLCFVGRERFSRQQWSIALFGVLLLLFPLWFPGLYSTPLASMERFVLECSAAFIVLARFGRRQWFHQLYLVCALPLQAFLVLQFVTNHWTV
jgi:Gpi18-like mannosyltransferase